VLADLKCFFSTTIIIRNSVYFMANHWKSFLFFSCFPRCELHAFTVSWRAAGDEAKRTLLNLVRDWSWKAWNTYLNGTFGARAAQPKRLSLIHELSPSRYIYFTLILSLSMALGCGQSGSCVLDSVDVCVWVCQSCYLSLCAGICVCWATWRASSATPSIMVPVSANVCVGVGSKSGKLLQYVCLSACVYVCTRLYTERIPVDNLSEK